MVRLKCSIAEERLSRQKNHYGFPRQAIECVMDQGGIKPHQILTELQCLQKN